MRTIYSKNIWLCAKPEWMVALDFRTAGDKEGVLSVRGIAIETCDGKKIGRPVWWDSEGRCWSRLLDDWRLECFDISEQLRKVAFDE